MKPKMKRGDWVVCVDDSNYFNPKMKIVKGQLYLVEDVVYKASLIHGTIPKLVFQTESGELVEIRANRFELVHTG